MPQATPRALVGRDDELRRLAGIVGLDGEPGRRAVLVGGDAGVGKSRLLGELRDCAQQAGWRVLVGHCLDFGDSALPYAAFSEAFGRLAAEEPAVVSPLIEARPALARLLPARRMLGDAAERAEPTDRAALFDAVHGALAELARPAPLLLIIEDVHWADQSDRDLLTFLFTRQFPAPVAVAASYRSDDLHRRHPLRAALAEWARLPAVTRLQLDPLDAGDMRQLVRALHPDPLPESELQRIVDRAEGNPFFGEELVAVAAASGGRLPAELADLLLVRLDRLDEPGRLVVRAASVVGRRVSHGLLIHGAGLDQDTLDQALRAAVEANVLVPVGGDGYAFRHALLAEAVYQDLLPGERVRLHAAYARALAGREVEGTAAELAGHARAAHDLVTAARASVQAGDEAMAVGGPDEAARHYEAALELLSDPDVAKAVATDADAAEPVDPLALVIRASGAAAAAGHVFRALALVEDHLRALPADAEPAQRARLLEAVAGTALLTDSRVDVLALTTEAVRLAPPEPTALRARVLAVHARANLDRARYDDAARWSAEALALARELGLPDLAADAATTLARLDERAGDPDGAEQALTRAVTEARAAGETAAELRSLFNLGGLHYEMGRLPQALEAYRAAWALARDSGRPWAPYGLDARGMIAIVAQVSGDWSLAAETVDMAGESPPGLAEALLTAIGLDLAAGRGDLGALELLPWVREWWERDGLVAIISGAAGIELLGQRGDVDAARAMHDDVVATVGALWQQPAFQARIRLGALLLGRLASAAGHAGGADRTKLVEVGDGLMTAVREVAAAGDTRGLRRGPESVAWLARASAEHARLRWLSGIEPPRQDELVEEWRQAVGAFDRFGHVYETARSRARLASVLRAAGNPGEAADELGRARAAAARLDAQPLLAELHALDGGDTATSERSRVLTAREDEILGLVAEGRSNSEIARQLFISAKTVSVHVSNILAKLGAGGRTEAVAIARRRGLLADHDS